MLQQDIQRRARQRHPGFEELAVAEQYRVLATLSRLPLPTIEQVLRPAPAKIGVSDFTRQVAHLQRIRNALWAKPLRKRTIRLLRPVGTSVPASWRRPCARNCTRP